MKNVVAANSPDEYVASLSGWQRTCVDHLRKAIGRPASVDEVIKWGHLVYLSNGPVFLIRSEEQRVLFGFWRGARLRDIEPRLKVGGKYEMATLELREDASISTAVVRRLVKQAVALNATMGNPTKLAAPSRTARDKTITAKNAARK